MRLSDRKFFRWVLAAAAAALPLLGAGCSGVNASQSVSPASFFLPGLLQADPPRAHPDPSLPLPPDSRDLAQVR